MIRKLLTQERISKKISQAEVSKRTGITRYRINRFDTGNGELTVEQAEKYANAVGLELCLVVKLTCK